MFELVRAVDRLQHATSERPSTRRSVRSGPPRGIPRVTERLGEAGIGRLLGQRAVGATLRELADEFEVSVSSIKRILRTHRAG